MKSAGKARSNGLYRHIRTSKEIIRNLLNDSDKYVITGHTPTQAIRNNPNPGYIYRQNNHIAIDCGATYPGGRLAAICLDTGEEYYSEPNKMGSDAIGL